MRAQPVQHLTLDALTAGLETRLPTKNEQRPYGLCSFVMTPGFSQVATGLRRDSSFKLAASRGRGTGNGNRLRACS